MGENEIPAGTLRCPDGTQFVFAADGTWEQQAWDGSYVRGDKEASVSAAELIAEGYDPSAAWSPAAE